VVAKQGNRVSLKNRKQKAGASRLFACMAGILSGLVPLLSGPAMAADAGEVAQVIAAVRGKYPDLGVYCKLSDAERRQVVVGTTMAGHSRKMSIHLPLDRAGQVAPGGGTKPRK
jgi:hypothetical protein